jgi:hypothetical protein
MWHLRDRTFFAGQKKWNGAARSADDVDDEFFQVSRCVH